MMRTTCCGGSVDDGGMQWRQHRWPRGEIRFLRKKIRVRDKIRRKLIEEKKPRLIFSNCTFLQKSPEV